jgi:hypothetical protein
MKASAKRRDLKPRAMIGDAGRFAVRHDAAMVKLLPLLGSCFAARLPEWRVPSSDSHTPSLLGASISRGCARMRLVSLDALYAA